MPSRSVVRHRSPSKTRRKQVKSSKRGTKATSKPPQKKRSVSKKGSKRRTRRSSSPKYGFLGLLGSTQDFENTPWEEIKTKYLANLEKYEGVDVGLYGVHRKIKELPQFRTRASNFATPSMVVAKSPENLAEDLAKIIPLNETEIKEIMNKYLETIKFLGDKINFEQGDYFIRFLLRFRDEINDKQTGLATEVLQTLNVDLDTLRIGIQKYSSGENKGSDAFDKKAYNVLGDKLKTVLGL